MDNYEKNYLETRPQDLCKKCGKCCRIVTTDRSYNELRRLANNGEQFACEFLEIFEPYASIDDAKKVDAGTVENILGHFLNDNKLTDNLTFYYCKYLKDDNMCSRYENRMTLCKYFPCSPWAVVPPGCGYTGWLFLKREEDKERVRKAKEELLDLMVLKHKVINKDTLNKLNVVEKRLIKTIDFYKKYGAEDW